MKKSKLLLTLVVVVLVCSMLFTLFACKPKEEEKKDPEPTPPDPNQVIVDKVGGYIASAINAENKAGMAYSLEIPLADTIEKGGVKTPNTVLIDIKSIIDPTTHEGGVAANPSYVNIVAQKKYGETKTLVFDLLADTQNMYLSYMDDHDNDSTTADVKASRKFENFQVLGLALEGNSDKEGTMFPLSGTISSVLSMALGMVATDASEEAIEGGTKYTINCDLAEIGTAVGELLDGVISGVGGKVGELLTQLEPQLVVEVKEEKITKFDINIHTEKGDAHVYINPTFVTDLDNFTTAASLIPEGAIVTKPLNITMAGNVIDNEKFVDNPDGSQSFANVYTYTLNADVDLFGLLNNLVKYPGKTAMLFKDNETKFMFDVKDATGASVLTAAMDKATLGTDNVVIAHNGAIPVAFAKALYGKDIPAMTGAGVKTIVLNLGALIADGGSWSSFKAPKSQETIDAEKAAYDALKDAPYVALDETAEQVWWNPVEGAAKYEVKINGVVADASVVKTAKGVQEKDYFYVDVKSGMGVEVTALKEDGSKLSKTSAKVEYYNKNAIIGFAMQAVNFLGTAADGIDIEGLQYLLHGVDRFAQVNSPSGKSNLSDMVGALLSDAVKAGAKAIELPNTFTFFDVKNNTMKVADLMVAPNGIYAGIDPVEAKGDYEKADEATRKVAALKALVATSNPTIDENGIAKLYNADGAEVSEFANAKALEDAIAAGLYVKFGDKSVKVDKAYGVSASSDFFGQNQTMTLVIANNFRANDDMKKILDEINAKADGSVESYWFPTQYAYATIKING